MLLRRWPKRLPRATSSVLQLQRTKVAAFTPRSASFSTQVDPIEEDTIYALSSAEGKAGVAVIRVSGPQANNCLLELTNKTKSKDSLPKARLASLRKLYHPTTKQHLDDALAIRFPQPNSFTGEDVVELHVHGSVAVVSGVLDAISHMPNCRLADAGEFTERAFDNHKMDLVQVEALADLLSAETEMQRGQALRQLSGEVGDLFEAWRLELIRCLAHTEALIDFGDDEDDVTDAAYDAAIQRVRALADSIRSHLEDGRKGEILRSGVQVAIVGPPNAGKSSLLNALARRPAAIVSSIAGTTRDIVQVPLNIGGYPVIVSDTAGLREAQDDIEKEGVLRAQKAANESDIQVIMMDIQNVAELKGSDYKPYLDSGAIVVLNKSDQLDEISVSAALDSLQLRDTTTVHVTSCSNGHGIDSFVSALATSVQNKLQGSGDSAVQQAAIVTRARHRENLSQCLQHLEQFLSDPNQSEVAAEDLRRAVQSIGRILGRVDVEDVLDVLFSDFCIGK